MFLFAAVLIRPLFKAKYLDKWASIESTFVADARFLIAHWPHPQWQPLWYAGTRFDYVYPPMLRYGTALISKAIGYWPVKAYHFYTAFFYALGIVGVYLFVRVARNSRGAAWLAALATALVSPSFLFLKDVRLDSWHLTPQRLSVLNRYGEGPHMTALAFIPFALAFTWLALERWRPPMIALAAISCAAVVSNNFYGATSLAVFYLIAVWSFWITRRDRRIFLTASLIPVLAYGLTAFWLTPSYFKITADNMKYVSLPGNKWSYAIAFGIAALYGAFSYRWSRGRADRTWAAFVSGALLFFALNVLGNAYFNFRVTGEPSRLVPELDLAITLAVVTVLAWMWKRTRRERIAAAIIVAVGLAPSADYLRHAWEVFVSWPDYQSRVEYKMSEWFYKNMPGARAQPIGSVRLWFDAWHDLAELGGGADQGLLNPAAPLSQWGIIQTADAEPAVLWMQAMGVDAVYVSGKQSQEVYKDFLYPQKFAGVLGVLFDDQHGNTIYRVPRRYPALARVVATDRINAAASPREPFDTQNLRAYVDIVEKGPASEATLHRDGTDAMVVRARVETGQSIVVQESYDVAWHAWCNGKELPVRKDAVGFMLIDPLPGDREIRLAFVTPLENQVGRVVTALAALATLALIVRGPRYRQRIAAQINGSTPKPKNTGV